MPLYVERMLRESEDLAGKIRRAKKVIEKEPHRLDKTQKMLLAEQIKYMQSYAECLAERIEYEKNKNK